MRWLKGVVIDRKHGLIQVELSTGRKVWATPPFKLEMRENVLISWDYTNDRIRHLTTNAKLEKETSEREKAELAMSEVFRNPSDEAFEGDVSDLTEPTGSGNPTEEESDVSEERSFPIPLDEDVGRDDVVLLRDDIHII